MLQVILLLLAIQGATSSITPTQADLTWRIQFLIGTVIAGAVMLYRWIYLEESKVWAAERKGVDRELELEGVSKWMAFQE